MKVWTKVQEIDDPKIYNDAYEIFSDPKRTARVSMPTSFGESLLDFMARCAPSRYCSLCCAPP
jgi:hypothetical protein